MCLICQLLFHYNGHWPQLELAVSSPSGERSSKHYGRAHFAKSLVFFALLPASLQSRKFSSSKTSFFARPKGFACKPFWRLRTNDRRSKLARTERGGKSPNVAHEQKGFFFSPIASTRKICQMNGESESVSPVVTLCKLFIDRSASITASGRIPPGTARGGGGGTRPDTRATGTASRQRRKDTEIGQVHMRHANDRYSGTQDYSCVHRVLHSLAIRNLSLCRPGLAMRNSCPHPFWPLQLDFAMANHCLDPSWPLQLSFAMGNSCPHPFWPLQLDFAMRTETPVLMGNRFLDLTWPLQLDFAMGNHCLDPSWPLQLGFAISKLSARVCFP